MSSILIIGASSGIGLQLASLLSDSGHRVIGTYNSHAPDHHFPAIEWHPLNVLDDTPDYSFLPETLEALVYCPGSILLKPFHRMKPKDFMQDYQLNVSGAIQSIQATLPCLKKGYQSSILLFSSAAVQMGLNFHTSVASSKGAIEGLTRALAAELAPHIRVNCIAPSLTDTPLASSLLNTPDKREANAMRHPLKRIGRAMDIAELAAFLISDRASWMTGQVLHLDGGITKIKA